MARTPVAIATWQFGEPAVRRSYALMTEGAPALDAVEAGINVTELDPEVATVGYGGRPNARGELELDAAIMDGTGRRAGSVAALRRIRTPISVARKVMDLCPHVMLVGEGAFEFALSHGFSKEDTDYPPAREAWEAWKQEGAPRRWLGGASPENTPPGKDDHDTIGLAALDSDGRIAVGCSTSGLAFKYPGRVGDSPIIGSGLYVDARAGAAAATGVGEVILRHCLSFLTVEKMREGQSPQEACNTAILRLVETDDRYATLQVGIIALALDGSCGAASTRPPEHVLEYAVASSEGVEVRQAFVPLP